MLVYDQDGRCDMLKNAVKCMCAAVIVLMGSGMAARGDWEVQESGVDEYLRDIFFIDESHGWIVGNNSTVLTTTDGGSTWLKQDFPFSGYNLMKVQFVSQETGYIIGYIVHKPGDVEGYLFKTVDGGTTWEAVTSSFDFSYMNGLSFVRENTGWIAAQTKAIGSSNNVPRGIFKTTDGGITWEVQYDLSTMGRPYSSSWGAFEVTFLDDNYGWLLNGPGGDTHRPCYLAYTDDGGLKWQDRGKIPGYNFLYKIHPVSKDTLWVDTAGLNYTTDNGVSWSFDEDWNRKNTGAVSSQWIAGVYPVNGREAFILNRARLMYTADAGQTMTTLVDYSHLGKFGNDIFGIGGGVMWICGFYGLIARYSHVTTRINDTESFLPEEFALYQNYPNPWQCQYFCVNR